MLGTQSNTPLQETGYQACNAAEQRGICTHRALTLAAFIKYPCKHGYFPKCPVGALLAGIKGISPENIAYVDETGIDTYLYRDYGYAPRGGVQGEVSGRKYSRVGIVAAKRGSQVAAPLEYSGTMDSTLFEWRFTEQLLPALPQGSVIVMDNAAFHRKQRLLSIAEENGHRLVFLPPYSPELNPIEKFWGWLKRKLRKILPSFETFDDALLECFKVD